MSFSINQITPLLLVSDLELAITFYVRQLGFKVTFRYEDFYAGIEKDGHSIHLKTDYRESKETPERDGNDDIDLIFAVDNLSGVFAEISKMAVDIIQPLREMPYGCEFYISDPDGHVIARCRIIVSHNGD